MSFDGVTGLSWHPHFPSLPSLPSRPSLPSLPSLITVFVTVPSELMIVIV
ncbi:Uncharacterised protein [Streptococcus pneumoniae]|nr:Uncharacterised protein [Streptococcus pneumoniae]